jgi:RNA polymerase sigma-70 factor (ECF subfamily)
MKPGIAAGFQDESDEKEVVETFLCTRSEVAFGKLASLLFIRLVRYFSIRGLDAHTAEELAQDVLMIIYRKAEMLRNKESFYGWLYKIARNQHLQHVRRHKHDAELVDLDRLPPSSTEQAAGGETSQDDEFLRWIGALESDEQQIMILRYVEELSYQEIATTLAIPIGTVKWKIFDAKMRLAGILSQSRGRLL